MLPYLCRDHFSLKIHPRPSILHQHGPSLCCAEYGPAATAENPQTVESRGNIVNEYALKYTCTIPLPPTSRLYSDKNDSVIVLGDFQTLFCIFTFFTKGLVNIKAETPNYRPVSCGLGM